MSSDKNPIEDAIEEAVERSLDAFVYAPIGLLFDGPARFPKLVRNGRTQVSNARMMGQFAVQMGRTEVEKRAKELDGPVADVLRSVGLVPERPAPAPTPTRANEETADADTRTPASGTKKARAAKRTTKRASKTRAKRSGTPARATKAKKAAAAASAPAVETLPIPDYDSLSASQVVSRLRGLGPDALEAVRLYETATRGRKTVLSRVQQLQQR